jgi:hypothetical protein
MDRGPYRYSGTNGRGREFDCQFRTCSTFLLLSPRQFASLELPDKLPFARCLWRESCLHTPHFPPLLRIALSGWQIAAEIFDLRLDLNAQGSPRNLQGTTFLHCGLGFPVHCSAWFSRVRRCRGCARYYYRGFAVSDVCISRCWLTLSFGWRTGIIRAALRTIILEKPDTKGISVLNVFCRGSRMVSYVLKSLVRRVITNVIAPTLQCSLCPRPKLQSV